MKDEGGFIEGALESHVVSALLAAALLSELPTHEPRFLAVATFAPAAYLRPNSLYTLCFLQGLCKVGETMPAHGGVQGPATEDQITI